MCCQRGGGGISWLSNNTGGCKGVCARLDDVVWLKEDYDEVLLKELEKRAAKTKKSTTYCAAYTRLSWTHLL